MKSLRSANFLFFDIFIDYALTVVPFPPIHSTPSCPPSPSHSPPPYSSCPGVIHISFFASTFPILFLPSPCLFSTYHLCYLFSVPFPSFSPSQSPIDNPPCDLHFCGSVSVLVVCLVFFCFGFRCVGVGLMSPLLYAYSLPTSEKKKHEAFCSGWKWSLWAE